MTSWPRARIRTYTPNLPVFAKDLDRFQDAIVNRSHGIVYQQYRVDTRHVITGTWAVQTSEAIGIGSLAESSAVAKCQFSIEPPPAGSRVVSAALKIKDGGGTSFVKIVFSKDKENGTIDIIGFAQSTGTGVMGMLAVPFAQPEYEVDRVIDSRWTVVLTSEGGGVATRRVYGFELGFYRP